MRTVLIAIGMLVLGAVLSRLFFHASQPLASSVPVVSTDRGPSSSPEHRVEASSDSARSALPQAPTQVVETSPLPKAKERAPRPQDSPTSPDVLDLKDCLQDPELNPDGLVCPTPAVEDELRRLIIELNERAITLDDARNEVCEQISDSKMASGLDPKETWDSFPDDQIRYRVLKGTLADGKKSVGSTLILIGERPELEEVLTQIVDAGREARAKVKERIAALCVR